MKNIIKKISFLCCFLLLSGCGDGSLLNTQLIINEDQSGARLMEVVVDKDVVDSLNTVTMNEIHVLVEENTPEYFTVTYNDVNATFDVVLNFSSLDDYISKVEYITQVDESIEFIQADTSFIEGVYVEESFTSLDLLSWMSDLLVSKGYVKESKKDNIFIVGESSLTMGQEEYVLDQPIYIDTLEYTKIESFTLYTDIQNDTYTRIIEVAILNEEVGNQETEILERFQQLLPKTYDTSWTIGQDETVFSFTIDATSLEELNTVTKNFFQDEESMLVVEKDENPYVLKTTYQDNISFLSFTSDLDTKLEYWVRFDESLQLENQEIDQETQSGYYLLYDGDIQTQKQTIEYILVSTQSVDAIDIVVKEDTTKTISIYMSTLLDDKTIEYLEQTYLDQITIQEVDNKAIIHLIQDEEQAQENLTYTTTKHLFGVYETFIIEDSFYFQEYIRSCSENFVVTYYNDIGDTKEIIEGLGSVENHQYIESFDSLEGSIMYQGKNFSIGLIMTYTVATLGIITVLRTMHIKKKNISKTDTIRECKDDEK